MDLSILGVEFIAGTWLRIQDQEPRRKVFGCFSLSSVSVPWYTDVRVGRGDTKD